MTNIEMPISESKPDGDRISAYKRWQKGEGIPVIKAYYVPDMMTVQLEPWDRMGALGAFLDLEGTGELNNAYVCEILSKVTTKPQRHLFEEIVYVLKGSGATTVWNDGMTRTHSFEWKQGAVFALPPNVWYKHTNLQGAESARFCAVTSAPIVMNLFHNDDFVFGNNFIFSDRFNGDPDHFSGSGTALPGRIWETNFVPDACNFPLESWPERGGGGTNAFLEIGNGTLTAHISEFQTGRYKKAHRHGPGAHVIILSGEGYSLMWPEGEEKRRFDWKTGSIIVPPEMWFHQHFNTGPEPARYLALRWGSKRFPLLRSFGIDRTVKDGGSQIEYEDEDVAVRKMFEASLADNGALSRMER